MKTIVALLLVAVVCNVVVEAYTETECPTAPASPQDRRTDKTTLRVATYNAEWLFLYFYSSSNCPGSGCAWNSTATAQLHLQNVAKEISIINPDILNLVEVEDCAVLQVLNQVLQDDFGITGYLPYLLRGTDTATGQNVGLLTRVDPFVDLQRSDKRGEYPQPGSKCGYTGSAGTQSVSKHYYTSFHIQGWTQPLTLIGAHFLAFPTAADRCAKREAQAWVIQQLESQFIDLGDNVIVLGDLNDYDGTVADPAGDQPTSMVLQMLKDPIAQQTGMELLNAAQYVSSTSNRYSCWYNSNNDCTVVPSELTLIDHVIVSKSLQGMITNVFMDHSYGGGCNSLNSDHWPVIVDFQTTGAQGALSPIRVQA